LYRLAKFVMGLVLGFSFLSFSLVDTYAATKVMWGKTELKLGQIGKVTILSNTELVSLDAKGSAKVVRKLKAGEEFRVYSYKGNQGGFYGVGGGSFVPKSNKVKYETPSKAKLALLKQQSEGKSSPSKPVDQGNGLYVIPGAPSSFPNCTAMKEYYPDGVAKGHPAYESKHDRDKDNWACEK
jgi:hypothetical protein